MAIAPGSAPMAMSIIAISIPTFSILEIQSVIRPASGPRPALESSPWVPNGQISVPPGCSGNTSGVNIRILKNGSQIWPAPRWQNIPNGTSYTFPSGVTTSVNPGDQIQFVDAHAGSVNYCNSTSWEKISPFQLESNDRLVETSSRNKTCFFMSIQAANR